MGNIISENEEFIRLMQVLGDNPELKRKVTNLLKLDPFNRKSVINTMVHQMILSGEPEHLIEAFSYLTDDKIAEETIRFLEEEPNIKSSSSNKETEENPLFQNKSTSGTLKNFFEKLNSLLNKKDKTKNESTRISDTSPKDSMDYIRKAEETAKKIKKKL